MLNELHAEEVNMSGVGLEHGGFGELLPEAAVQVSSRSIVDSSQAAPATRNASQFLGCGP